MDLLESPTPREIHATLILNTLTSLGPARTVHLIEKFKSAETAVRLGPTKWAPQVRFEQRILARIQSEWVEANKKADNDMRLIEKERYSVILWHSSQYPQKLREINVAPPIIYVRGEPNFDRGLALALVGSRRCTYYGEKTARQLSADLVAAGVVTVSGLARGIDRIVHQATVEAGGTTWAVLGSGLENVYPPNNKILADRIVESGGMILSEFPLDTLPYPSNFPQRNRIIAGLTSGTIVVEGSEKSGSLITARIAAHEGRDVFAVPGPIQSFSSRAPHLLIQNGAKLIHSVECVLEEYSWHHFDSNKFLKKDKKDNLVQKNEKYDTILSFLGGSPVPKDELISKSKMNPNDLSVLIIEMELNGLIETIPGGFVVRKK